MGLFAVDDVMMVFGNRTVGINVSNGTAPSYDLTLGNDSAAKPTTNTWTISSDQRVKLNIQDADLDILYNVSKNLKLKYFEWDPRYFPEISDRHSIGFIAQEVAQYYPKAVDVKPQTFKIPKEGPVPEGEVPYTEETIPDFNYLNTDQLMKCLWGTVQKLIQDKEALEARVAALEAAQP